MPRNPAGGWPKESFHQPAGALPQIRHRCRRGAQTAGGLCRGVAHARYPLPYHRCRGLRFHQPRSGRRPPGEPFAVGFVGRARVSAGRLFPFRAQHLRGRNQLSVHHRRQRRDPDAGGAAVYLRSRLQRYGHRHRYSVCLPAGREDLSHAGVGGDFPIRTVFPCRPPAACGGRFAGRSGGVSAPRGEGSRHARCRTCVRPDRPDVAFGFGFGQRTLPPPQTLPGRRAAGRAHLFPESFYQPLRRTVDRR